MPRQASTPFPGVFTTDAVDAVYRAIPTADLIAELESWRWLALRVADLQDGSRAYVEYQIAGMVREIEWRQRMSARRERDAVTPAWPTRDRRQELRDRTHAVKDRWPIEIFVSQVLHAQLNPVARGEFVTHCPLPGHDDSTPSFRVYPDGHAHCFGCGRGGDVIALAGIFFGIERFTEKLELLEAMSGIGRAA